MSKIRVFGLVFAATAGIVMAGSGLASAETGTTPPVETGSASVIVDLAKALATGSSGTTPVPPTTP
ncbi:hypothetical protein [Nocardia brasiliensis]|uniref:hypothetical protein n=1 Tax=Nocardia brasiliensis TaxID=37326 RepID=UPI00366B6D99